ncbi:MAG: nucleotide exchange factor GrpE, partial [Opitutales bacterium]
EADGPGVDQICPDWGAGGDRVAELERALVAADLKAKEAEDARLRTLAEMENQRRRLARDREEARRTAASKIIEELLPALDNLQMGLQMAGNHPEAANVAKGFEFVVQQIESILATNGLEKIDPGPGEDFDPHKAEAVGQEASPEVEDGQVLRCQRAGYELNGRLLRAAMVVIAKSE